MRFIKTVLPFLMLAGILSCEKEEETPSIVGKKFVHHIPGCERPEGSEINCSEFFLFKTEEEAAGLVGGSDIVMQFNYHFKNKNTIEVYLPNRSLEYTFSWIHPDTLLDVSTSQKWVNE